jgi:hypothetical protein
MTLLAACLVPRYTGCFSVAPKTNATVGLLSSIPISLKKEKEKEKTQENMAFAYAFSGSFWP